MSLTDVMIRSLKPEGRPYKRADAGGLYLEVRPTGAKLWRFKYRHLGKDNRIALGAYANGKSKGLAVEPLFKSVPEAALRDERLYEYLALIDASRLGNQRESNLARAKLEEGLLRA